MIKGAGRGDLLQVRHRMLLRPYSPPLGMKYYTKSSRRIKVTPANLAVDCTTPQSTASEASPDSGSSQEPTTSDEADER